MVLIPTDDMVLNALFSDPDLSHRAANHRLVEAHRQAVRVVLRTCAGKFSKHMDGFRVVEYKLAVLKELRGANWPKQLVEVYVSSKDRRSQAMLNMVRTALDATIACYEALNEELSGSIEEAVDFAEEIVQNEFRGQSDVVKAILEDELTLGELLVLSPGFFLDFIEAEMEN